MSAECHFLGRKDKQTLLLEVVFHAEIFGEENEKDEGAEVPEGRVVNNSSDLYDFHVREGFIRLVAADLAVDEQEESARECENNRSNEEREVRVFI